MKYKIQNHFAHNDAQVFASQKCISVFVVLVSANAKRGATARKRVKTVVWHSRKKGKNEQNLPQSFHLNDWIAMLG